MGDHPPFNSFVHMVSMPPMYSTEEAQAILDKLASGEQFIKVRVIGHNANIIDTYVKAGDVVAVSDTSSLPAPEMQQQQTISLEDFQALQRAQNAG